MFTPDDVLQNFYRIIKSLKLEKSEGSLNLAQIDHFKEKGIKKLVTPDGITSFSEVDGT